MPARKTLDVRGAGATPAAHGAAVLADPTGRRARRMRLAGRLVAAAFALWLSALVLAGLGLLPTGSVPLAHRIHSGPAPREDPGVARAGTPAALVSATASGPAARAVPVPRARAHTTRPASGHAPSRTPKRTAARKRAVSGTVPLAPATPHARNPHPATPRATANPKPNYGKSGTTPGHTRTPRGHATLRPTATGTPAPMPTPKPHEHSGGHATSTPSATRTPAPMPTPKPHEHSGGNRSRGN
jgi:hypothetical protein